MGLSEIATQTIAVDASSSGNVHFFSDADYYVLTVSKTGSVTIDLTSEDADVFLNIYGGKTLSEALLGDPLSSSDDVSAEISNSHLELALSSGSYIIESGAYGAGSYTLSVSTGGAVDDRVGPVALDLNSETGDQRQRQTDQVPKAGDTVSIDLVATEGGNDLSGFQVVLSYNSEALQFSGVTAKDLFAGAVPLDFGGEGKVTISMAFFGTDVTPREIGSMAEITFEVLEGFTGETGISLISGEFARATEQQQLDIGGGGAFVTIGGEGGERPLTPDFDGDGTVGFSDFLAFAQAFGSRTGGSNYDPKFDLDSSGDVGFADFLVLANKFGQSVGGKPARLSKPVKGQKPGVNDDAGLSLAVPESDQPDQVRVVVEVKDVVHLSGYSLRLVYDPAVLEPVDAVGPEGSAFVAHEISGVALQCEPERGQLILADVLNPESALTQDGQLVMLTFRVLDPTAVGRVDIVEALTADGNGRMNVLSGASVDGIRSIPTEFALDQNYPNPFNPDTIIQYQLPKSGDVALFIYNVLGQKVRTLINEPQETGYYQTVWDGKDALGRSVSSGVYIYRLVSGQHVQTRRMLLLK